MIEFLKLFFGGPESNPETTSPAKPAFCSPEPSAPPTTLQDTPPPSAWNRFWTDRLHNNWLYILGKYAHDKWPSESEKQLNRAVADRVYDEHVYKLDGYDFLVVPLAVKGLRAGARWLMPTVMDAAVSHDHPGIREEVLRTTCGSNP